MDDLMPRDTSAVLSTEAAKCESRSLLLDRFANPAAKDKDREQVFTRAFKKPPFTPKLKQWQTWIRSVAASTQSAGAAVIYAQLQSRLMINMAGGVMENAGLCIDRFGFPYIPGSAVKGCARRAATQSLLEATSPEEKIKLLTELCLVFGWGETDWQAGRRIKRENGHPVETEPCSDFWWAMAPATGNRANDDKQRNAIWQTVAVETAKRLLDHLQVEDRRHQNEPWLDLPNFAGTVCFLAAYPVFFETTRVSDLPIAQIPTAGTLELDVITCHHMKYYDGKLSVAFDSEDPNPVVFPAVAAGHVFAFPLLILRNADRRLLMSARRFLADSLSTFGIGAKTSAGYGWFDCSDTVQTTVEKLLLEQSERERIQKQREAEAQQAKAQEEAKRKAKLEREAALAGLPPEARADKEIEMLTDQQFDNLVRAFCKDPRKGGPTDEQRKAIVRALRGPRSAYWNEFKREATKGEPAKVANAIRELSKKMNLGKMP